MEDVDRPYRLSGGHTAPRNRAWLTFEKSSRFGQSSHSGCVYRAMVHVEGPSRAVGGWGHWSTVRTACKIKPTVIERQNVCHFTAKLLSIAQTSSNATTLYSNGQAFVQHMSGTWVNSSTTISRCSFLDAAFHTSRPSVKETRSRAVCENVHEALRFSHIRSYIGNGEPQPQASLEELSCLQRPHRGRVGINTLLRYREGAVTWLPEKGRWTVRGCTQSHRRRAG